MNKNVKNKNYVFWILMACIVGLPSVEAFATGATSGNSSYVDNLEVTIASTCTFSRLSDAHEAGDNNTFDTANLSSNVTGNWGVGGNDADTLSGTMAGNAVDTNFGKSHFKVICNNAGGWSITAEAESLVNTNNNTKLIPFAGVNTAVETAGTAKWGFTTSVSGTQDVRSDIPSASDSNNSTNIQNGSNATTGNDGVSFYVQYAVATSNELPTGTYEGSVTYTFAQLDSGNSGSGDSGDDTSYHFQLDYDFGSMGDTDVSSGVWYGLNDAEHERTKVSSITGINEDKDDDDMIETTVSSDIQGLTCYYASATSNVCYYLNVWKDNDDMSYYPGDGGLYIHANSPLTLTAKWEEPNHHYVNYYLNSNVLWYSYDFMTESDVANYYVDHNSIDQDPAYESYDFVGWEKCGTNTIVASRSSDGEVGYDMSAGETLNLCATWKFESGSEVPSNEYITENSEYYEHLASSTTTETSYAGKVSPLGVSSVSGGSASSTSSTSSASSSNGDGSSAASTTSGSSASSSVSKVAATTTSNDNSGLIVALCAVGVAGAAAAGAYLYNKDKKEE